MDFAELSPQEKISVAEPTSSEQYTADCTFIYV